jgi:hypothetical protein
MIPPNPESVPDPIFWMDLNSVGVADLFREQTGNKQTDKQ